VTPRAANGDGIAGLSAPIKRVSETIAVSKQQWRLYRHPGCRRHGPRNAMCYRIRATDARPKRKRAIAARWQSWQRWQSWGKAGIAIIRQRLVNPFAAHAGIAGQFADIARTRHRAKRAGDIGGIISSLLQWEVRPMQATATAADPQRRARRALEALSFFMADMQAGIGPFLGVFLQQRGWQTGAIGLVMTLGGVAGMVCSAPAGALVDATSRKRSYIIGSGLFTVLASWLIWFSHSFWVIVGSQVATAIAGAAIGPAVAGVTLGIARQSGFNRQNGRNQAWNHAGNMAGAGLSGLLGWRFGFVAVFWLAAAFGVLSIVSVLMIPRSTIDDRVARGLEDDGGEQAEGWAVFFESRPLLVLAAALALFHLGNGAMLPLYGMAVVAAHLGDPALFVAATVVVAQAVMVVAAIVAMRLAERRGYWLVILITFIALPVRARRRLDHPRLGGVSGAGARRHRRRAAERGGARAGGAHPAWKRPRQCRPGRGDDCPGAWRGVEPGDRWGHRAGAGLSHRVSDAGVFLTGIAGVVAGVRPADQAGG